MPALQPMPGRARTELLPLELRAHTFLIDATVLDVAEGRTPAQLHFQPIVDLAHNVVAGFEALARFPGQDGRSAELYFAAADRLGCRAELEDALIRATLKFRSSLPPNTFLSLNVSPAYLLSPRWSALLASVRELHSVVIEITEQQAITNYPEARARLDQVRRLGGWVAVDDAGSGFASLKHVLEMKPHFIKLDRSFVDQCHTDTAKATMIEMLGRAASRLDAWIIAEGIEEEADLALLRSLGVPLGQGYLLARPGVGMRPARFAAPGASPQTVGSTLAPVLERCPAAANPADAVAHLHATPGLNHAVVLDPFSRPVALFHRDPRHGIQALSSLLVVQLASDPAEVAHRALTRPALTRFDPLAVTDEAGHFQGIVSLDRLVRSLLSAGA